MPTYTNYRFENYAGKHAVLIDTVETYDFDSVFFDQSGINDIETTHASGIVTINILNGGTVPTVTITGAGTVVIVNTLNYQLTGLDAGADVTIADITVPAIPVGLFNEVAGVDGIVTYSFDGAISGTAIGVYIRNSSIENNEFNDILPAVNRSFSPSQDSDTVYI